ncbi:MAG: methyltransferase domain-containing protein [Phycisphaerales bacterium]|nr:methyltransferase domain-containing protein [Phycisphaerales bacterium]MCB9856359.1 methyltransferase domain-containing protein [Phycisphaerales bacterium]MCB9864031.1 methyltransferase domain-containing protein [Phycisphaerales bacterium]
MGKPGSTEKAPGHWVLARLGKKVLRPGGMELTRRMLDSLNITSRDDVVEFAPGLGATARLTLDKLPRSYIAVERDETAAEGMCRLMNSTNQRCVLGRAEQTGLPDASATVVYGEATLTMQTDAAKRRIVEEAARLLAKGGRYGIHEMALSDGLTPEKASQIGHELTGAIHHAVIPLSVADWRAMLESCGLKVTAEHTAPMHLLEPKRLFADEGTAGAVRFAWNLARDSESRSRVLAMRDVFRRYERELSAVSLVATKR